MKTRSRAKGLTALLTIALFATTAACSSTSAAFRQQFERPMSH